jgi:DNA-binding transcriptional MerR regulator
MFTVGEFSQLAQVSKRLLRYYDEIGLLRPVHTDPLTGYRYYSAEQLPTLNRILALKDLGLSLEQIQRILHDRVSSDEIHGMLLLKKAEIEQHLQDELQRIRNIESRLQAIRNAETRAPLDVVVKQIPAQPVLSVRTIVDSFETGLGIFGQILNALPPRSADGLFFVTWHSGGPNERDCDVEIGQILASPSDTRSPIVLSGGLQLRVRQLPAVPMMATYVAKGPIEAMHIGYSAIGTWVETNRYRFSGPPREVALQQPQAADRSDGITEIQFPIEPVGES